MFKLFLTDILNDMNAFKEHVSVHQQILWSPTPDGRLKQMPQVCLSTELSCFHNPHTGSPPSLRTLVSHSSDTREKQVCTSCRWMRRASYIVSCYRRVFREEQAVRVAQWIRVCNRKERSLGFGSVYTCIWQYVLVWSDYLCNFIFIFPHLYK